jgi:hypothetical protein
LPLLTAAQAYLGFVLLLGGEWQRAQQVYQESAQNAERLGHPQVSRAVRTLRLWSAYGRGDEKEIEAILDEGPEPNAAALEEHQYVLHEALHAALHTHLHRLSNSTPTEDRLGASERDAVQAQEIARRRGDLFAEGLAVRALAQVLAERNAADPQVDEYMRRSRDLLESGGCKLEAARTLVEWGRVGLQRNDPDACDRIKSAGRIFEASGLSWELDQLPPC